MWTMPVRVFRDVSQAIALLLVLAQLGKWFTFPTTCYLCVLLGMTVPKLYQNNKAEVRAAAFLAPAVCWAGRVRAGTSHRLCPPQPA